MSDSLNQEKITQHKSLKIVIFAAVLVLAMLIISYIKIKSVNPINIQPTPTQAIAGNSTVALVGARKITLQDIKSLASQQYLESAIDKKVLNTMLDNIIERKILDQEAQKLGINISDQELSEYSSLPQGLLEAKRYELLKSKMIGRVVASREAYVIGFWIPPYFYPQEPMFEKQRTIGMEALAEIEKRLKKDEEPLKIARSIYVKYPLLQNILSLNGYLLKKTSDINLLTRSRIYQYDQKNNFYDTLFLMQANEVKQTLGEEGSGGSVIKVISVNNEGYKTYEEWLNAKKAELVKIQNSL